MGVYHITIFGIHLTINPIAFTLPIAGGWNIYWYGLIIAAGFLGALVYAMKNAPRFNINTDRMLDVVLITTPLAILSARAYYIIFDPDETFRDFFDFSSSGFQGLAIYGGVIAAIGIGAVACRLRKVNILDMFDLAAVGFLIGQGVGRWGNFTNQEAFGGPTGSSWWGMMSENTDGVMVHPCFLYESIWCIAGVFLLNHFSKKRRFRGEIILLYGVWYGFGRGFIEILRSDSLYAGVFKISCLLSFVLCIASAVTLTVMLRRCRETESSAGYVPIFDTAENNKLSENDDAESETVDSTAGEADRNENGNEQITEDENGKTD